MKKAKKFILIVIVILAIVFAIIDYKRITNDQLPIFMIRLTGEERSIQTYLGLGYRFGRSINVSYHEPLYYDNQNKFGLWFYTWDIDKFMIIDYVYNIETLETRYCKRKPKLYQHKEGYDVYIFCLEQLKIAHINKDLKDYYEDYNLSWNHLIDSLIFIDATNDGGTKIYKDPGPIKNISDSFTNNGLTVIKCNTIYGNKDVYIGPKWMNYETDFCLFNSN